MARRGRPPKKAKAASKPTETEAREPIEAPQATEPDPGEGIDSEVETRPPEPPKRTEVPGVLFVRPARLDGPDMQPRYYDPRVEKVPPAARTGNVEYRRIADPDNPKIPLTIHSSKRIKNRRIVRYLINKNRPNKLKATTRGILLYTPQEAIDQGFVTQAELDGLNKGVALDDCNPPPPIKNFGMLTNEAIDRYALDRSVPGFNITWSRKVKEQYLTDWIKGLFDGA